MENQKEGNHFHEWGLLKQKLDTLPRNKLIREGVVWFCSVGKNIGHEEDGKNAFYERPVLIVRKFTADYFWDVPLMSTIRTGPYSLNIYFQEIIRCALLFRMRSYDTKRLQRQAGAVSQESLKNIRRALANFLVN